MEHIRFKLDPDLRRNVEQQIDRVIISIVDNLNWTQDVRTKEELTYRMHTIQKLRNKTIADLMWNIK